MLIFKTGKIHFPCGKLEMEISLAVKKKRNFPCGKKKGNFPCGKHPLTG
jgi:hypothetical protein